jgi:Arc/MetJ family transcription regulator
MQITLDLDEDLLDEAFQLTNLATQEELLNLALKELVRPLRYLRSSTRRKKNLLDLAGQIQFAEDFDHKALRQTRHVVD